jgi:predicted solute-binding protein
LGGRGRQISEFEASLVFKVSSRTARATEKPCLKKQNKTKQKKPKKKKKKRKKKKRKLETAVAKSDVKDYYSTCTFRLRKFSSTL